MPFLAKLLGLNNAPQQRMSWGDDAAFLRGDGGYQSETGLPVSHGRALMLPAVWQCINLLAGDLAKLPLYKYERREEFGENGRERRIDALTMLVNRKPNEEINSYKLWHRFWSHRMLYNRAYLWIERGADRNRITALANLLPDRTWPMRDRMNGFYYETEVEGQRWRLLPDEVFHVEGLNFDNLGRLSLLFSGPIDHG